MYMFIGCAVHAEILKNLLEKVCIVCIVAFAIFILHILIPP